MLCIRPFFGRHSMNRTYCLPMIACVLLCFPQASAAQDAAATFKAKVKPFLDAHCVDCHGPEVKKAGLRLDELRPDFADPRTAALWIKTHDKIAHGEMPPKKRARPPQADLDQVTQWLNRQLHAHSREKQEKE